MEDATRTDLASWPQMPCSCVAQESSPRGAEHPARTTSTYRTLLNTNTTPEPPRGHSCPSSPPGDPGGTHSRDRAWLCWKRSSGRACSWLRFSRLRGRRKGSRAGEESCQPHPGHSFGSLRRARFQVMGANWALIDLLTILQLYADRTPSC